MAGNSWTQVPPVSYTPQLPQLKIIVRIALLLRSHDRSIIPPCPIPQLLIAQNKSQNCSPHVQSCQVHHPTVSYITATIAHSNRQECSAHVQSSQVHHPTVSYTPQLPQLKIKVRNALLMCSHVRSLIPPCPLPQLPQLKIIRLEKTLFAIWPTTLNAYKLQYFFYIIQRRREFTRLKTVFPTPEFQALQGELPKSFFLLTTPPPPPLPHRTATEPCF